MKINSFRTLAVFAVLIIVSATGSAQRAQNNSEIDYMLFRGEYKKAIDTCRLILNYDSLNAEIHYKLGIACQNFPDEDLSFRSFYRAVQLCPGNKTYVFSLAKSYYSKGKYKQAGPLLETLYRSDTANWTYANFLSGVYMQTNRYEMAFPIYQQFQTRDTSNYIYLDKMAFVFLKIGNFQNAIQLYEKSLNLNSRNLSAIKNLAYLYTVTFKADSAINLLSRGLEIDSTDMDLYTRRAQVNFSKHYTKRALDDYLKILAYGDSSKIYLKRAGIGYCNNFQPREAIDYLLKAYSRDSSDDETCNYLGQCYFKIKDMKSSTYYYNKAIELLLPSFSQLGMTYSLCAGSQNESGNYQDAVDNYLKGYTISSEPSFLIYVATIYDEKLNNRKNAIYYYQKFLNSLKKTPGRYPPDYIQKIQKRLAYLKYNVPK